MEDFAATTWLLKFQKIWMMSLPVTGSLVSKEHFDDEMLGFFQLFYWIFIRRNEGRVFKKLISKSHVNLLLFVWHQEILNSK